MSSRKTYPDTKQEIELLIRSLQCASVKCNWFQATGIGNWFRAILYAGGRALLFYMPKIRLISRPCTKLSNALVLLRRQVGTTDPTPNLLNRGPHFVGCLRLHIQVLHSCSVCMASILCIRNSRRHHALVTGDQLN